jgi:hypothetical protein
MVRNELQDVSGLGQPISLATAVARTWSRVRDGFRPRCPYRIGDAVLGDDPFYGRHEGTVVSQEGCTVGVKTASGLFFYDHRQLRRLD